MGEKFCGACRIVAMRRVLEPVDASNMEEDMRKIVVSAFVSLDGVMQAPGGPDEDPTGDFEHGGWIWPLFDETMNEALDALFAQPFDLLLGRKTYDIFAAYWPHEEGGSIGSAFNRTRKYVATGKPDMALNWHNSRTLGTDVVEALRRLKQEDGPMLLTQGSADFLQTLFRHGLVDELYMWVFPLVLGRGKTLFRDGAMPQTMKLIRSVASGSGIVLNQYRPDGPVVTGSFASREPSEAELERRRKLT